MKKAKGQSGAELIVPSTGDLVWEDGKVKFIFLEFGRCRARNSEGVWGFWFLGFKDHRKLIYSLCDYTKKPKLTPKYNIATKNGERIYYYSHLLPHPTNEGHWVIEMKEGKSEFYKEFSSFSKYSKLYDA